MMQDREFVFGWDSKSPSKRSSGLFSVLKWFGTNKDTFLPPPDLVHSTTTSSSSSCESLESVFSTETIASFAFIPPNIYRPFGGASQPEKFISTGPESVTYRARLAQREASLENDRNVTLRSKYNLYKGPELDRGHSLPLLTKTTAATASEAPAVMHRRTASESSKHKRAGAYCHVKGKRKAPPPPGGMKNDGTLRRKKRLAPKPPAETNSDVICNDSLKLDRGILKSAKNEQILKIKTCHERTEVTPRPWYKRTLSSSSSKSSEKKLPEADKRKSALSFLTNISELDREAMEIVGKENLKMKYLQNSQNGPTQVPDFMRPRPQNTSDGWMSSPKRKSARDLIAKFNAITGVTRVKESSQSPRIKETKPEFIIPVIKEREQEHESEKQEITAQKENPSSATKTAVVKPISRAQWNCPRCTLENDYWRIICRVCSTIKPYFDDFTTPLTTIGDEMKISEDIVQKSDAKIETKPVYPKISIFDYKSTNLSDDIFQPQYPKITLNLNKEIELTTTPKTEDDNKSNSIFDFNLNKKEEKPTIVEIKEEELSKSEELKPEKIILGDELSYQEPKASTYEVHSNVEAKKRNNSMEVEQMILGDEISVEKPDYVNVNKYEIIDVNKNRGEVERIILGDDITNKQGAISKNTKKLDEEKQNSAKREEREKLKKMLIEMKNSLPKRNTKTQQEKHRVSLIQEQSEPEPEPEPEAESEDYEKQFDLIVAQTETVYENIKVKKQDVDRPIKVSSSVQTNSVFRRNLTPNESDEINKSNVSFQLIGEKDFIGISTEKTTTNTVPHTYANLNVTADMFKDRSKTDTLEINRLLRRLETSIAGGELGQAAVYARELAQLKVPLNVIRQNSTGSEGSASSYFNVDMYVEDKISHRGPFPLQVNENMSVAELKQLVENKYKMPIGVQRWILGKQLATDDNATLSEHNITAPDCPVFLYLVAPITPIGDVKQEENTIDIVEISETKSLVQQNICEEEEDDEEVENVEEHFEEDVQNLWKCRACTLLNPIVTNECEVCGLIHNDHDEDVEDNSVKEKQTYLQLVDLDNEDLVRNVEPFECLICLAEFRAGEGVTLRECLHQFCRTCLANTVEYCEEAEVKCPYRDNQYACDIALQDREVKSLVSPTVYEQHLAKSVKQAENKMNNTFHCKTPDCKGWCIYEDNVNDFLCPVCRKWNCLTCQAIHTGMNCKQYQEQMKSQSETDEDARRTRDFLEDMIKRGEALACPTCQVVLLKKWGCDWLRCSMCKTEICWVTRGPRWGPGGKGDTNGGCKCGVNGIKCHPKCNYCH